MVDQAVFRKIDIVDTRSILELTLRGRWAIKGQPTALAEGLMGRGNAGGCPLPWRPNCLCIQSWQWSRQRPIALLLDCAVLSIGLAILGTACLKCIWPEFLIPLCSKGVKCIR